MNRKQIIGEAWEFTQDNKKMIFWYAFVPSLISILAGIIYLLYQFYAFKSSAIFENWNRSFTYVVITQVTDILKNNIDSIVPLIVTVVIIALLYFFVPSICQGAIIQLIARKRNKIDVKTKDGIRYGLFSFLPMFEYATMVKTFSVISLLGNASFVLRNLGWDLFFMLLPIMILFLVAGLIMSVLFTYSEFFIVIDNKKVIEAITKSCILVVKHLEDTILISILMIIISVRIVLQILFVLLIPALLIALVYAFSLISLEGVGIVLGLIAGVILLYIASYLTATVHVFASTVWTLTFLELTSTPELTARGAEEKDDDKDD